MNLIERKREEHRSRTLQRVGSVLVCMSLLLAVAFPPQEARAFAVVDDAAIAAIVSAFLSSCGMTFSASGMDAGGVKEQVGRVIDQYLNTMMGGKSALEWFGDVAIGYNRGKLLLPSVLANKLADLAQWVKGEYGVEPDGGTYHCLSQSFVRDINGKVYRIFVCDSSWNVSEYQKGDVLFNANMSAYSIVFSKGTVTFDQYTNENGSWPSVYVNGKLTYNGDSTDDLGFRIQNGYLAIVRISRLGILNQCGGLFEINENETGISQIDISSADTISIPETIPDTQEVVISTGAASDLTLDDALDQILAAIAAGELSATKEIAEAGTATGEGEVVTPVEESMPVIADLGLPELGATLTTRFPFSIPWDVTRAIKLLAAPAKTPYFEVDFFAPVADTFGGFPASTKLVLDFSQFEILGQLSRWTSTIGFCLLLASGTKKLIWTA